MKKFLLSLAVCVAVLPAAADEGMWLLPLLKQQKYEVMKAMGLELEAEAIYNPAGPSLKDAVVIFGGGCTGEIISPEGLVLTNHHCGYGYVQSHSTLGHDYLTDGFWASSRDKELPNPGLKVTFIDKIDDVTDYVNEALESDTDPGSAKFLSASFLNELARKRVGEEFLKQHPGTEVEIKPFYGGNRYYLFTKKVYSDVRLVGVPPSSIGKFGADTDNWMWPRHTGDFSLFRVYADKDGRPAPYSETNVPLKTKQFFKISLKGVNEYDYVMMMGFPGRTNKYYTSWEVAERRDIDNAVRINVRNLRQQAMLEEMLADPEVRIQYASKYAGSTNAYKNAIGSNWAINKRDFENVKKAEQEKLKAWTYRVCEPDYRDALLTLEQIVTDRAGLRFRSWMLDEALVRGIEFSQVPVKTEALETALKSKNKAEIRAQLDTLEAAYRRFADKDYSPWVDKKVAKVLLKEYIRLVPEEHLPAALKAVSAEYKGNVDAYVDDLFETSVFGSPENFARFQAKPSAKALQQDKMIAFGRSVEAEKEALKKALAGFDDGYAIAHRNYVKGLLMMNGEQSAFPDANFTLRLTYGQAKGYQPRDAVSYDFRTTLEGVMEKEDPDNWEFVVDPALKQAYQAKDFGPYALPDGRMPVAFAATTHTTGGNSGSPVMNGRGELVGINFDRNWEGVGGDIQYLPDYQRSIIADIRYVLFVIDKVAGAGYLLDEMELTK